MLGQILLTAINAVLPILLLILLGYILKQVGFLTDSFVKLGHKLVFNVCLPVMLFINIYDVEGFSNIAWDIVLFGMAAAVVLFGIAYVVAIATTPVPERRGVVMQCVFRSNFAIIGLPLAEILGGSDAIAVAAVMLAFTIPLFNIFAVLSLSVFMDSGTGKGRVKGVLLNIVKNPLIIAAVAGLLALCIRQLQLDTLGSVVFSLSGNLEFLYITMGYLKSIVTPLSLIVLGGQFVFSAVKGMQKEIIIATVFRVVVAPVLGIGAAYLLSTYTDLLHCGTAEYPALVSLFGTPVAVSSAVMAAGMKNDAQLATQLVVWTSVSSIVTLFLLICVMMGMGLLPV